MYRTKQDVDRHVTSVLARIKDEKERNARGYQIAKLYYEAKEYEISRRYLAGFLSIRENLPQAHKLMGLIHEATGQSAQAVASFKRSLELDDKQKDVVYKICEQYSKTKVDPDRAKFWAERGERFFPNSDVVFKLKEMSVGGQGNQNFKEMEGLMSAELVKRPGDVELRIRLLKLYCANGRVKEAFEHVVEIEHTLAFVDNLPWYEYVVDLFQRYQTEVGSANDNSFYSNKLLALCNLTSLSLQYKDVVDSAEALHRFDQSLLEAFQLAKPSGEWNALIKEMQGQFYYLAGTLLLKRAQRNQITWRDASCVSAACYLVSHQFPPLNATTEWFVRAPNHKLKSNNRLHKISFFRCSQTGHMLNVLGRGDRAMWREDIKRRHCTTQGRDKLYDTLFTLREMRTRKPKSYLNQSKAFCDFEISFPSSDQLAEYDSVGHLLNPENLHRLVWMALQHYSEQDSTQPAYDFNIFSTLQYTTTTSLENASPESLCQLDVEVFLYATVRCRATQLAQSRHIVPQDGSQPDLLPAILCKPLCSKEQADWWESAYKLYANIAKDNFPKLRLILQRGLETVRLIGNHGMSANLIVHIAKTLEERASDMRARLDKDLLPTNQEATLQNRTAHCWLKALELLRKLERNQSIRSPRERLFQDDSDKQLTTTTIKKVISEGEFFMASISMTNQRYEEALAGFEKLEQPYASYRAAQIYRLMAFNEISSKSRDQISSDLRSKYEALLIKARDAFYLTLDRLRGDKNHELNKLLSRDLDDIETRLSRAETEDGILNDTANLSVNSEDFESPMGMTGIHVMPSTSPGKLPYLAQSTPLIKPGLRANMSCALEEELPRLSISEAPCRVRPSPERLEAQMRALTFSQETLLKTLMERNEELVRNNKDIVEELKETRNLNKQLQEQMSQSRIMAGGSPYIPGSLGQTMSASSPYIVGAPLQTGGFPYSPQPAWMPQYGYQMQSPGPAGAMRFTAANRLGPRPQLNQGDFYAGASYSFAATDGEEDVLVREDIDDDPYHIDGEYFAEEASQPYYLQDIQEWPYGNRAGMEGRSTITYQPTMRPQSGQPNLVGPGLRNQAPGYGYRQPIPGPPMPGPGYFSSPQTQASVYPTNTGPQASLPGALAPNAHGQFSTQESGSPKTGVCNVSPAMPPNMVASGHPTIRPNMPGSLPSRPQLPGKSPAYQGQASNPALVQKPEQSQPQTIPTLPEGIALLFAGKATITSIANQTPTLCSTKILHITRGARPMVAVQAVSENKEVFMNHEFSAEVQVKPQMFSTDTFIWIKTGSVEKFVFKFADNNEAVGFNLAVEKVKLLLRHAAAAKQAAAVTTVAQSSTTQPGTMAVSSTSQTGASAAGMLTHLAAKHKEDSAKTTPSTPVSSETSKGDPSKNLFGGFSFKTTPVVNSPSTPTSAERQKAVPHAPAKVSPSKPAAKPFEGFSFSLVGSPASQSAGSGLSSTPTVSSMLPGAAGSPNTTQSPGSTVSNKVSQPSPGRKDSDHMDEYEPNIHFQPVIPLPDLVEVKTGEEEEEKLFSERCRLFRFDIELKQWKERGVGDMKLLRHPNSKRTRIIMRRDQVLKLCANHYIAADMNLSPMAGSDKAWCWRAMDYADEEVKNEQLAVRFKNAEIASKFKTVFEDCVKNVKCESEVTSTVDSKPSEIVKNPAKVEVTKPSSEVSPKADNRSLMEMFKPASGTWECSGCFIRNAGTVLKCPACATLKPGVKPEDIPQTQSSITTGGGSGFQFGSTSGFTFASNSASSTHASGFKFGSQTPASEPTTKPAAAASGFIFGIATAKIETSKVTEAKSATDLTDNSSSTPLNEMFKKPEGSWSCNGCLIVNGSTVLKCPACGTLKPGVKAEDIRTETTSATASGFKFGTSSNTPSIMTDNSSSTPLNEMFKKPEGSWSCNGCLIVNGSTVLKCPACGTLKPGVKAEDIKTETTSATASGFKFGTSSNTPSIIKFGTSGTTPSTTTESGFTFGTVTKDANATGFKFGTSSTDVNKPSGFSFTTPSEKEREKQQTAQGKTLKDLLQSDAPTTASPFTSSLFKSETPQATDTSETTIAPKSLFGSVVSGSPQLFKSESPKVTDTSEMTVPSKSLFGLVVSRPTAATTVSGGDSFVFGSPLTKFTFSGVAPSTPSSVSKPLVIASPKSPEVDDHGHYLNKDGEDSHIYFEPVVKLPEKVEVKTGEEHEEVLFENRAKLYRFDTIEWKERGLGVVKLLQHTENKRVRILMRREQILKICCNHQISGDIELKPMPKADGKAWVWHAVDYADQEYKHEKFAIRFKTPEIANHFKAIVDMGKNIAAELSPVKSAACDKVSVVSPSTGQTSITMATRNLFSASKAAQSKDSDDDVIFVSEDKASPEQVARAKKYQLPDNFYLYESCPPCPGCLGCVDGDETQLAELLKNSPKGEKKRTPKNSESSKTNSGSLFGSASSLKTSDTSTEDEGSATLMFGNQSNTISFAALAQTSSSSFASKSDSSTPFLWSGAGSQLFGAGSSSHEGGDHGDDEVVQSNDIHFEPIISLPEMKVKTGEEDDEVLFCQRAKLFRFDKDSNQWKERGIGELKILRHKITGVYRILQRRQQVFKISCNHLLTPDLQLKPMSTSESSWCWIAMDYADEEPKMEQFACRFKNVEIARDFKEKFIECQEEQKKAPVQAAVSEEIIESSVRKSIEPGTGDRGNPYYTLQLDQQAGVKEEVVESSVNKSIDQITGDHGNIYYTRQLDQEDAVQEEIVEASVVSSSGPITGDRGNVYYSKQLDQQAEVQEEIVEASLVSSSGLITGDRGNVYYSRQLDQQAEVQEEIVEASVVRSSGPITGDRGNVYYSRQLDQQETTAVQPSDSRESDKGDNSEQEPEDEYEDVEDDEDDDDDILETIFEKRATLSCLEDNKFMLLGMGDLKVLYDDDVTGHRISMETDDDTMVCNHIISKESIVSSDNKKSCDWAAVDFSTDEPIKRHFRAQFSSTPALLEFLNHFEKGRQLAFESDISERDMSTFPREITRPEVVCSPDEKDGMPRASPFGGGTAGSSTNENYSRLLGSCCPEITAAMEELLKEGSKAPDADLSYLEDLD